MEAIIERKEPIGCFISVDGDELVTACNNLPTGMDVQTFDSAEEAQAFLFGYAPDIGLREELVSPCLRVVCHDCDGEGGVYEYSMAVIEEMDDIYTVSEHSEPGVKWNMRKKHMIDPAEALDVFQEQVQRQTAAVERDYLRYDALAHNPYPMDFHAADDRTMLIIDTEQAVPDYIVCTSNEELYSTLNMSNAFHFFNLQCELAIERVEELYFENQDMEL